MVLLRKRAALVVAAAVLAACQNSSTPTGSTSSNLLYSPAVAVGTGSGPRALAVSDFNGDGKLDLVVAYADSREIVVSLGNAAVSFTSTRHTPLASAPTGLALADFNDDGRPDLAVTHETEG